MNRETEKLAAEVMARCQTLARFSEDPSGICRTFLSPPMRDIHREISAWLEPLGATMQIDAAGNLRALYSGSEPTAPRLVIGSHLDTVPNAGAYDGILGVVLAVEILQQLNGRRLPYAIEVVGFSEEEGVRFGIPFIGSRALVGRVDEELLAKEDQSGISVRQAIRDFGLDPCALGGARISEETFAYLEFHIEQGPVLEKLGLPLAVVEAIAGQSRLEFTFSGRANHAGTTPMDLRLDAVAAAAEWITIVEHSAKNVTGLVATVGILQVKPGAVNVIAAEARVSLDVRHRDDSIRTKSVDRLIQEAQQVAAKRGLSVQWKQNMNQPAVAMDSTLCAQIEQAMRDTGCTPHRMTSGAGHDAMIMAEEIPSAMIFLRTPGGISHDPAESVGVRDVAMAIDCGSRLLQQFAVSSTFQKRTARV